MTLTGPYCSGCGQKSDTHRISLRNFIFHDVLHGTFHLEKGILFTARQALLCPGKAALDYIAGKRKRFYNVFYLVLITFGLILFLRHFLNVIDPAGASQQRPYLNDASRTLDELFSQKSRIIIFLFVPFAAMSSFIVFKRKKLNLSEHAIIAGMVLLAMLLVSAFGNLFFYLDLIVPFEDAFSGIMSWIVTAIIIAYIAYGYFDAFGNDYSKPGMIYRIVLLYLLIAFQILVLFYIVWGIITGWKYGTINVTPF